jgi:hypothetical protein
VLASEAEIRKMASAPGWNMKVLFQPVSGPVNVGMHADDKNIGIKKIITYWRQCHEKYEYN